MITKDYNFTNDTHKIFEGFYESTLFNSEQEYEYNQCREEGEPEMEVEFEAFKNDVGRGITDLLRDLVVCDDNIITRCEFDGVWSPTYYNYTTDKLDLLLDVDLDALKDWALSDEVRGEFDSYLNANYTSYSGYVSFVKNNVDDYFDKSWAEYSNVLVEFYMLTKIYKSIKVVECMEKGIETDFFSDKWELTSEAFYENLRPVADAE